MASETTNTIINKLLRLISIKHLIVNSSFTKIAIILATTAGLLIGVVVDTPQADASMTPTPLIVDDDGSQDGMTALAYMLANPGLPQLVC